MDLVEMSLVETDFEQTWSDLIVDINTDYGSSTAGIVYYDGFLYARCKGDSDVTDFHKISLDGTLQESREIISSPTTDDISGNGMTVEPGSAVFYWLSSPGPSTGFTMLYWYDWAAETLGSWTINDPATTVVSGNGVECTFSSFSYLDLAWTTSNGLYLLAFVELTYAPTHIRGPYATTAKGLVHVDGSRGSFSADSVSVFEVDGAGDVERIAHCQNNIFIPVFQPSVEE